MRFGICMTGAAAMALAVPAQSADLAPGEIALHISAQGSIPAEFATWQMDIVGEGATKAEAEAALDAQEAQAKGDLNAMGPGAQISISDPTFEETEQPDWEAYRPEEVNAADIEENLAEAAAYDAPDYENLPKKKVWTARATMTITLSDSAKIVQAIAMSRGAYSYSNPRPIFGFADEAKASRDAVAAALANARKEAEAHADAMGYRIVRIAAVSNNGAPLTLPSIIETIATLDNPRQWPLLGQKVATVTVDYVIAPK